MQIMVQNSLESNAIEFQLIRKGILFLNVAILNI